jgi:hypothetical protein
VRAYRAAIVVFAIAFICIGVALVVVTATHGGGIGYLLGALFVAAGVGRLVMLRRRYR